MWDWRHVLRNCKHSLHEESRQNGEEVQNGNKKRDHLKLSQVLFLFLHYYFTRLKLYKSLD